MTTAQQRFTAAIDAELGKIRVSIGCRGEQCEYAGGDSEHQCESGFSTAACDSCCSSPAGDRSPATGIDPNGNIYELSICVDCVMFHANGDLPETWE